MPAARHPRNNRRSIRLATYDYTSPGAYYLTICTYRRARLFGTCAHGQLILSPLGLVAAQCWRQIPSHFPGVELDAFVFMPDHMHGVVRITDNSTRPVPLSGIVRGFKIGVTMWAREALGVQRVWHRNYYEHVVRNTADLDRIRRYIDANPRRWIRGA